MPWGRISPASRSSSRPDGVLPRAIVATCGMGRVNCGKWITVTLLATLLMGCASQSAPCRSIDPQDLESEGAREYCRDLAPLRALEVAVADEAYALLKEVGLAPGATPGVAQALSAPAMPAP